ncbi:MAG: hypothetical protein JRJ15_10960 [Deltaproteobacteria bacterium]|nr:hypothetical protein [Deltaproteobacteria bacterium]
MATSIIPAGRPSEGTSPELESVYYNSNALRLFADFLKQRPEAHILDLGPVCGENISFLAQLVKRLYVCDMFFRLVRDRRKGIAPSKALRHLDYTPQSFDGILLWDLADRLDDPEVGSLMDLCRTLIKPSGMVIVFDLGKHPVGPSVNTFVICDNFRVYLRPQPHLDLPLRIRQSRDVITMADPLKPIKSFIYRNGLREFLFQQE